MDFDGTMAELSRWIGSDVNVQVLGDGGMVLNVEGVLGRREPTDTHEVAIFTLDGDGSSFLWLERERHQRTIWANNAQTVLLVETMGLAVTIKREQHD